MANFFKGNEPLVITNTNLTKQKKQKSKGNMSVGFISQKITIYLSSLLVILSLFLPFEKAMVDKRQVTYTMYEMDNITTYFIIGGVIVALIGALVNSKVVLGLSVIDLVYSLFRFITVGKNEAYSFADNLLATGFYVFCIGMFFLIFTSLWYVVGKRDQLY